MQALSERQIEKAVNWWTVTLGLKPKFDNLGPTRGVNKEETVVNDFASVMAGVIAERDRREVKEGALEKFAEALRHGLSQLETRSGLHVDYGPDRILSAAAQRRACKMSWSTLDLYLPAGRHPSGQLIHTFSYPRNPWTVRPSNSTWTETIPSCKSYVVLSPSTVDTWT